MKYKLFAILLIALAALSPGCRKSIKTLPGESMVKLDLSAFTVVTKSESPLVEGYRIGAYVPGMDSVISSATVASNRPFEVVEGKLVSTPETYLLLGKSYDIFSYAPYKTDIADPSAITFTHGDDVVTAPKQTIVNVTSDNHSAALSFTHLTSQIKIILEIDPAFDANNDSRPDSIHISRNTRIEVVGFETNALLNLSNGALAPQSGGARTTIAQNSFYDENTGKWVLYTSHECFFIPAAGSKTLTVNVLHAGIDLVGEITREWVAGESYIYTVTAKKNSTVAICGLTATLADWVEVNGAIDVLP